MQEFDGIEFNAIKFAIMNFGPILFIPLGMINELHNSRREYFFKNVSVIVAPLVNLPPNYRTSLIINRLN